MHADEEPGVAVHFYNAFDSPLVKVDVLRSGQRHEAVRQKSDRVDARLDFPFVPTVVVFCGGELERFQRFGTSEVFIACFARKIPRQDRVIRLANHDQMIAVLLNDHSAALVRSVT